MVDAQGREITLYKESHALLIGVSDYTHGWPDLPGVKEDLRAVGAALEAQGFKVELVNDPDQAQLEAAYRNFILRYGRVSDNRLLFYFAGHGHTEKPVWAADDPEEWLGYIVSKEAPLPSENFEGFRRNALSMQRFEELAKDIHAKHALFIFDSCFSGSVFALSRSKPPDITRRTAKPVRQFITSGSADQEVPDVSIFRRQFVAALQGEADRGGDGYVTGSELGYFLTETVTNYSEGAQTPQAGKIRHRRLDKGDFVFVVNTEAPPAPPMVLRGHLQVNVNTPARIKLDGKRVGEAAPGRPLNHRNLPVGTVEIQVEAPGYLPATRTAKVQSGQWEQLVVQLVPQAPAGIAGPIPTLSLDPEAEEAALNLTQADRRRLQQALNERGFSTGVADGVLGQRSRHALAAYQRSEGLEPSGYLTAEQWAGLREPVPWRSSPRSDLEPELVSISGGCFQMGSPANEEGRDDDERQHRVCVEDFKLGKYEVTVQAFRRFVEATGYRTEAEKNAGGVTGCYAYDQTDKEKNWDWRAWANWRKPNKHQENQPEHPVACVSWNDVQAYIAWLNRETGQTYRLPTEAEWEYAARSGTTSARFWGEDPDQACRYANVADQTQLPPGVLVWSDPKHECNDGYPYASPVGRFHANGYGLYDILGNLWEGTCSVYDKDYGGDEQRCASRNDDKQRVGRGGSWGGRPGLLRSADRGRGDTVDRFSNVGFRLAQGKLD